MKAKMVNTYAIFVLYYCLAALATASPIVNITSWGMGRGVQYSLLGSPVNVFYGVPYAQPPTDDLRFAAPNIMPMPWKGIRNFTERSAVNWCMQSEDQAVKLLKPSLSEDCLYLNIFIPGKDFSSRRLPVMFWIHGGGFVSGSSVVYDGAMLAIKHQVVVVTINYRLGVLGFLHIPGTKTTGNYGMLDQIAALKWVQSNIESFGGNREMVTIFGESAGSAAVSLLVISSLSKGLFKRAISESGTASAPWAVSPADKPDLFADGVRTFGTKVGCTVDFNKLLECLKSKSSQDLVSHQMIQNSTSFLHVPSVDKHFLAAQPWEMIMKNQFDKLPLNNVEYLLGFNRDEGTLFTPFPPVTKEKFQQQILSLTQDRYPAKGGNRKKFHAAVEYKYTDWAANAKTPFRWYQSTAKLITDFLFTTDSVQFANAWVSANKVAYVYEFTHAPKHLKNPLWGVTHALDIDFVFGKAFYPANHTGGTAFIAANFTEADRNVSRNMMKMWAGFAKNGDPGFGWPKYTMADKSYLNIALQNKVEKNWKPDVIAFWSDLVPKLNNNTATGVHCKPTSGSSISTDHCHIKFWLLLVFALSVLLQLF